MKTRAKRKCDSGDFVGGNMEYRKGREVGMNTEREKIINIAYRVYKAHGSREAIKADTKYGEFVVIDEKGNPVEEGIERVIKVMERLQEENKK